MITPHYTTYQYTNMSPEETLSNCLGNRKREKQRHKISVLKNKLNEIMTFDTTGIGETRDERRQNQKEKLKQKKKYFKTNKNKIDELKKEITKEIYTFDLIKDEFNWDDLTEDDWKVLLDKCESEYIKNLLPPYKTLYENVKHLRNENFLILLNKIKKASDREKRFVNTVHEHPEQFWSDLCKEDFYIS